ncbi:hypothetical protein SAMN02745132_03843 [Enterovibrio nigricans DSM 22720]|uniref:Acetyltransferase (GNAT) domain-containing protein n=1 Tax=Enterovibrio nigricans DSM 22720 TaxID=1121868 RepID=A0A1T4VH46_9GAMM|nr:hypothetical protein SAMN02745132_03843 [Enterovibrio nigricans DSM 22720]
MKYLEVDPNTAPLDLLLEADPSESSIQTYLSESWCYVVQEDNETIGACIVRPMDCGAVEIYNIAVCPN